MLDVILDQLILSEKEFRTISDLVYKHCGINLHAGKKELVRARLAKRLRALNIKSFSEYIKFALSEASGNEFTSLIDSLSTNLTSFFREPAHFEHLRKVFYPAMMQQKRACNDFKIKAWSAGCSSGEEPYSLAISLLDSVNDKAKWDIKVLASDISTRVLAKAKQGIYDKKRVEHLSPQQKQKYFLHKKVNGQIQYEVSKQLRDVVTFAKLNLMEPWPITTSIDFIFCRNVMIYFDKPTQENLVNRYWELLGPSGLLFTGHSESLTGINHKFNYVQPTIYAKGPQKPLTISHKK